MALPRSIFLIALVLVKLQLEAGLGILDAHQCTQRSLERLTANRTNSDRWNASEILNYSKTTFCHADSFPRVGRPLLFPT
jgi:hypothetical protein